jgi:ribonuclease P protein component
MPYAKTHISTKKKKKGKNTRISHKDAYNRRAASFKAPTHQKTQKAFSVNDFLILFKKTDKIQNPRIVISKKVAKLAVDRNRVKRLFREALKKFDFGQDQITVIVKNNIADYKMSQVKEELEKMTKKLKIKSNV